MPRWVFCYVGNKTFDFSSRNKDFLPKNDQIWPKLAFLVNLGQAMQAYSVPCWWIGWWLWRAGCISQDTYLLYVKHLSAPWCGEWWARMPVLMGDQEHRADRWVRGISMRWNSEIFYILTWLPASHWFGLSLVTIHIFASSPSVLLLEQGEM